MASSGGRQGWLPARAVSRRLSGRPPAEAIRDSRQRRPSGMGRGIPAICVHVHAVKLECPSRSCQVCARRTARVTRLG